MNKKVKLCLVFSVFIVLLSSSYTSALTVNHVSTGFNDSSTLNILEKSDGDPDEWVEQMILRPNNVSNVIGFGGEICIDGDNAFVGGLVYDEDDSLTNVVYIFHREGVEWAEQEIIAGSNEVRYTHFGNAISVDGDYALIAADGDSVNGIDSGSAYIFHYNGESWVEQAKLLPEDGRPDDFFGHAVSLDGDYAVISSPGRNNFTGAAYVFRRDGVQWTQQVKLLPEDGQNWTCFGTSVGLERNTLLIGAVGDDVNGNFSGSIYVFSLNQNQWILKEKIFPENGRFGEGFGFSLSLQDNYVVVGTGNSYEMGIAYVFHYDGDSWVEQVKLTASDGEPMDFFSSSVSLDGDYALIGAYGNNNRTGSAYIFQRSGSTWTQQVKLNSSEVRQGGCFGGNVAIDGEYVFIGAHNYRYEGLYTGAVFIYGNFDKNLPPRNPSISGPISVKRGQTYSYNISSMDPNDDTVRYIIKWGDLTENTTGFCSSKETIQINHTWRLPIPLKYTIRVKAVDSMGAESYWATLPVSMPYHPENGLWSFLQGFFGWLSDCFFYKTNDFFGGLW